MIGPNPWPFIPSPSYTPVSAPPLAEIPRPTQSSLLNLPLPPYAPTQLPGVPYTASSHVIPSAHPRVTPDVTLPGPSRAITKQERQSANQRVFDELRQHRKAYVESGGATGETADNGTRMVNAINRYVHHDCVSGKRKGGVTLFFAHANGFPKEVWEPAIFSLLASPAASSLVDEVWVWEAVQHGDSYLLNQGKLGGVFNWHDNARDISNFLLHFLPQTPNGGLPTHLPLLPQEVVEKRRTHGFEERTFVAVGHSYGGCSSTLAALTFPALFSSLILVDPVIVLPDRYKQIDDGYANGLVKGAISRRDEWGSRDEAHAALSSSPFFSAWDPSVLRVYCDRGIHPPSSTSTNVKLKMPGIQEAIVFLDTSTSTQVYQRLPELDERIELRWIMPGKEQKHEIGGPGHGQILCWRRPTNSSNIRIASAGHLIAQEAPKELAADICAFLQRKYGVSEKKARL